MFLIGNLPQTRKHGLRETRRLTKPNSRLDSHCEYLASLEQHKEQSWHNDVPAPSVSYRDLPGEYFTWLFHSGEQDRGLVSGQLGVDDQIRTSFNIYRP